MSRKDTTVSRGRPQDDVFVEKNDQDMGAYTVEPLAGIMGLQGKDFLPPVAGSLGYAISTWVVTKFGGKISSFVTRFAPLIGGVLGAVATSVALPFVTGGGKKLVAQAAATSLTMGILSQVLRETGGLGAIVMQRIAGAGPVGALPRVRGAGSMPPRIRQTIDKGVYGRTWA